MPSASAPIPSDLIARAHALGPVAVELVGDAYQRGQRQARDRARAEALDACRHERQRLDEELVQLDEDALVTKEAAFQGMRPSPIIAAFYEGAAKAIDACIDRLLALGRESDMH